MKLKLSNLHLEIESSTFMNYKESSIKLIRKRQQFEISQSLVIDILDIQLPRMSCCKYSIKWRQRNVFKVKSFHSFLHQIHHLHTIIYLMNKHSMSLYLRELKLKCYPLSKWDWESRVKDLEWIVFQMWRHDEKEKRKENQVMRNLCG